MLESPPLFIEAAGHIGQGGDDRPGLFSRQRGQTSELAVKIPGFLLFFGGDARIKNAPCILCNARHILVHQSV